MPSYAVYVRTRCVKDANQVANVLGKLFDVDEKSLLDKINQKSTSEITVKRRLSKESVTLLENYSLSGVYYSIDNSRIYPFNDMLCSVLGYTSSDGNGICGIESYYNKYLRGEDGELLFESDLVGNDISEKPTLLPSINGLNVKLSIDSEIQMICESAVDKAVMTYSPKSVGILVLNPQNCQVLAMALSNRFDLNSPPTNDISELNKKIRNGLVSDSYEPGSTFKIVTALANVQEALLKNPNALPLDHVFNGADFRIVNGSRIKCWTKHLNGKHSNETLSEALNNSCNPCFVDIALSLGKQKMYEYIEKLNFGNVTGIDFFGEAVGMLLPVSSVTDGDLARISFGQTIAVTPLQLGACACACVNGGNYFTPRIVQSIVDDNGKELITFQPQQKNKVASTEASRILASYLERVVSEGSGKNAYIEGYKVGGKTGTAQKFENGSIKQGKNIMSFMGFFPSNAPKYLALALVDEPIGGSYGSTVSAPIVKEVFEGIIKCKQISKVE